MSDDESPDRCDGCFKPSSDLIEVQTYAQTMSSPAEYERLCRECCLSYERKRRKWDRGFRLHSASDGM